MNKRIYLGIILTACLFLFAACKSSSVKGMRKAPKKCNCPTFSQNQPSTSFLILA